MLVAVARGPVFVSAACQSSVPKPQHAAPPCAMACCGRDVAFKAHRLLTRCYMMVGAAAWAALSAVP